MGPRRNRCGTTYRCRRHAVDAVPGPLRRSAGLPNAFITCSELDPLRDEAVDYALRLLWAGVATELHVFPGTCHGFDSLMPDWERTNSCSRSRARRCGGRCSRSGAGHPAAAANSRAMAAWYLSMFAGLTVRKKPSGIGESR